MSFCIQKLNSAQDMGLFHKAEVSWPWISGFIEIPHKPLWQLRQALGMCHLDVYASYCCKHPRITLLLPVWWMLSLRTGKCMDLWLSFVLWLEKFTELLPQRSLFLVPSHSSLASVSLCSESQAPCWQPSLSSGNVSLVSATSVDICFLWEAHYDFK